MSLKNKISDFFHSYYKFISVNDLMKKLHIDKCFTEEVLDILFELEKSGKIIGDGHSRYMHVSEEFCYQCGVLQKSKSNQYYIKMPQGVIYVVKDIGTAKSGDVVFVEKSSEMTGHPKQFYGIIRRIVKRECVENHVSYIVKGILKNDGHSFYVMVGDVRIYIPKNNLNTAFSGDLVSVRIDGSVGLVVDILKRHQEEHVFRGVMMDGVLKFVPIGPSYGVYSVNTSRFQEGDMVLASICGSELKVLKKLDRCSSIHEEINALIADFGFLDHFSSRVMDEISSMDFYIHEDEIKKRIDLRDMLTFTIDPVDAKDLDDAISLEVDDKGYHLYVHLANPTHYIKFGSLLFEEALRRSFSIYPMSDVIPMLPDRFCNDVCSLNEVGDKLAITCRMDIDFQGVLRDFDIFKSIIHNDKQMDYDTVNRILQTGEFPLSYRRFRDVFVKMQQLNGLLLKNKRGRGAILFDSDEKKFVLDEEGNPISIKNIQRGDAQDVVENFMLLTNETIAKFAYHLHLPYIYRNHECLSAQKKNDLKYHLVQKGYFIQKIGNIDQPYILQQFLNRLLKGKNKDERRFICEVILKSMSRAYYEGENRGHYGLALECYATFTSPARKISDLINHMVIEEFLDYGIESKKFPIYKDFIDDVSMFISSKQEDADLLEKEINSLLLDKYADQFIGQECNAKILFINKNGIYLKDEHGLVGVVPINHHMVLKKNSIFISGRDYYPNGQIVVVLRQVGHGELVYELVLKNEKKLVKKVG